MEDVWYNKLGYDNNPFTIKPAIINDDIIGHAQTIERIEEFLFKGGFGILSGQYGVGKTTLLKTAIKKFVGQKKVIYFSCNRLQASLNLDKFLHQRYGKIGELLQIKSKHMILLLDEAYGLEEKDIINIKKYMRKGYFKSVILVTPELDKLKLPKSVKIPEKHIFSLEPLSKKDAIDLIRRRFEDNTYFSDTMIGEIFEKSSSSRVFLKNCEDVCRYAFEKNHKRVSRKDIAEAL
ncbi:MAG: AAA family ATPase [Candidatus Woesearchaeota archaeon]